MWLKDYHLNKFGYKNLKIRKVRVISKITREISSKSLNAREVSTIIPIYILYFFNLISSDIF